LAKEAIAAFPGSTYKIEVKEQYRNMREMLDQYPQVMGNAMEAYKRAGLQTRIESIRGGTDGSRLSFMGLPCPNIFTGEMAIHSRKEYVSLQDMQKAVEVLHHLVQVWAKG
jgi:tripeptide aminopeptidase